MEQADRFKVGNVEEFEKEGDRIITTVNGTEIGVFYISGEYHAILNYCIHQSGPLCAGNLTGCMEVSKDGWEWSFEKEGQIISCPWHGWKFNVKDGSNIDDERYTVPTFNVEVDGNEIFVIMDTN